MRTNKSDLSDKELQLFDIIFDSNTIINGLLNDINLHGLDDEKQILSIDELTDIVNKNIASGLLQFKLASANKKLISIIGLTPKGGEVWESERVPIWEKYVMDLCSEANGFWELTVISPSFEIAQQFMAASHECKLYQIDSLDKMQCCQTSSDETFIPWKSFARLYKLSCKVINPDSVDDKETESIDWESYHNRLNWWRSVSELQLLKGKKNGTDRNGASLR